MTMEINYNVIIPKPGYVTPRSKAFWDFYHSEHKNMSVTYGTVEEAVKVQRSLGMIVLRNEIYNIVIKRRKNVVYVEKKELEGEHDD